MKILTFDNLVNLNIPYEKFYEWVEEMLIQKHSSILPPKTSIEQVDHGFFNIMPSVLPNEDVMGVKVVMRYPDGIPTLSSQIIIYRQSTGVPLAFMDGTYITAMRTGAVAAHSIKTFAKKGFTSIGFIGLGNTARATMAVFSAINKNQKYKIGLLKYKDHADLFQKRFRNNDNLEFFIYDKTTDLINSNDVIVSCVTYTGGLFADDLSYKPGCTVIPVHTRGFQNCDLFFNKVFADDYGHVKGFKYFSKFKNFAETSDVVTGRANGRTSDDERIIIYNIGISIHDIFFASKIYDLFENIQDMTDLSGCVGKFWV
jgi:ornithine cyclodeaminase/alanine dehydrogenase